MFHFAIYDGNFDSPNVNVLQFSFEKFVPLSFGFLNRLALVYAAVITEGLIVFFGVLTPKNGDLVNRSGCPHK